MTFEMSSQTQHIQPDMRRVEGNKTIWSFKAINNVLITPKEADTPIIIPEKYRHLPQTMIDLAKARSIDYRFDHQFSVLEVIYYEHILCRILDAQLKKIEC